MRVLLPRLWPARLRRPRAPAARLVGGITAGLVVAAVAFVLRFGSNVPIADEWVVVRPLLDHPSPLGWVFDAHNEHRFWLGRAVWAGLLYATGFDFRAGMIATAAALGTAAVLLTAAAAKARGSASAADLVLPALLLHWGHGFNLLMGYQLSFALVPLCAAGLLGQAVRAGPGRETRAGVWAGGWLLAMTGTGGFGLAFAPPVAAWLAYLAARAWRDGRRAAAGGLVVAPTVAVAYLGWTLAAMPPGPPADGPRTLPAVAAAAGEYLACAAGPAGWGPTPVRWGLTAVVAAAELAAAGLALRAAIRSPGERPRAVGLLCVLAGHFAAAAGIAWTRPDGLAERYVTTSAAGAAAAWLIAVRYGPRAGPLARVGAVGLAALLAAANAPAGYNRGMAQRMVVKAFEADLRAGMPPAFLAGKHGWKIEVFAHDADTIRALRDRGHAVFRDAAADPPLAAVPAGVAVPLTPPPGDPFAVLAGRAAPPAVPVPPPGRPVTGLRVAVVKPVSGPAVVRLRWTDRGGSRTDVASAPITPAAARLTFWMPGAAPTDAVLEITCPAPGMTVLAADWLVPDP